MLINGLTRRRMIARGRKRGSSSCVTSQANSMADTSTSVTMPIVDASERRPKKRQRRSLSTPAAPRPPQPLGQRQSRRRSRSRAGSPTTDVEYAPPPRASTRLARRIHSFIHSRSSDIYTHLAARGPDGAGTLLSESSAGSVILSAPNETVDSEMIQRPRGRRRKVVDLTEENAKKNLMEEWARMRQFQGILPLSGIDENASFGQTGLRDSRKGDGPASSVQLEATARKHTPDPELRLLESQATSLDDFRGYSLSHPVDSENTLHAATDEKKIDHIGSMLPSDDRTKQPLVSSVDTEAPSTSISDAHRNEDSPSDKLARAPGTALNLDPLQQYSDSSPPTFSLSPSRNDSVIAELSIDEQAEVVSLSNPSADSHSVAFSQTYSLDNSSIRPDSNDEFYMLDIPEIFTLPWEPVNSRLYVPPGLGKLVSGTQIFLVFQN